jgi:hypothetical protein
MTKKGAKTDLLLGQRSLAALTSPVRLEIFGEIKEAGPCSVRELAKRMDRRADGLYHHVRVLVKAGVLVESEVRRVGRRDEAVYRPVASRIAGQMDPASQNSRQIAERAAGASLRLAGREMSAAIRKCTARGAPAPRIARQKSWLTEEAIAELNRHLGRIEQLLTRHARKKRGRPYALTTVLVPLLAPKER